MFKLSMKVTPRSMSLDYLELYMLEFSENFWKFRISDATTAKRMTIDQ